MVDSLHSSRLEPGSRPSRVLSANFRNWAQRGPFGELQAALSVNTGTNSVMERPMSLEQNKQVVLESFRGT